jgi:hypothetical protein
MEKFFFVKNDINSSSLVQRSKSKIKILYLRFKEKHHQPPTVACGGAVLI